ncbi:MAG: PKD domain-containing protein [Methanosarcinales archaeon]|nr:PKD domain-containing protein [Methanosarcinales archaeon]
MTLTSETPMADIMPTVEVVLMVLETVLTIDDSITYPSSFDNLLIGFGCQYGHKKLKGCGETSIRLSLIGIVLCLFVGLNAYALDLYIPEAVEAGQEITISGAGAQPGELVTISESMTKVLQADPWFRMGGTFCILSTDVNQLEVYPVDRVLIGWQHQTSLEQSQAGAMYPYLRHDSNPYSWWRTAVNGRVRESKPYHGADHTECWKMVMAGQSQMPGDVQVQLTAKRAVRADSQGNFSTTMMIPLSKLVAGQHTLAVQAGNVRQEATLTVDASSLDNEPPMAYIYAPELSVASWQVPAGRAITLNGGYSADNDGSIASYSWDFGDGATANGAEVRHAYITPGTRVVTLTVTDNIGAQDQMKATITVL